MVPVGLFFAGQDRHGVGDSTSACNGRLAQEHHCTGARASAFGAIGCGRGDMQCMPGMSTVVLRGRKGCGKHNDEPWL